MFINGNQGEGWMEKEEGKVWRARVQEPFHLLKLNGLFCCTKTLQNASLNLSHKTLIVDWLLNALEAREKIAGSPSTVWHETPASFLFSFARFILFQVEIMLLVLGLRQREIRFCSTLWRQAYLREIPHASGNYSVEKFFARSNFENSKSNDFTSRPKFYETWN